MCKPNNLTRNIFLNKRIFFAKVGIDITIDITMSLRFLENKTMFSSKEFVSILFHRLEKKPLHYDTPCTVYESKGNGVQASFDVSEEVHRI